MLGPLALIPLAIIFGKKREERANDVRGNRIRKADKLARKYLSDAKKKLGDQKPFYESLFFFQAEDGIRNLSVTGVQTCALPI